MKKREKYATVMVDIETHTIIDMLESREQAEVVKWLKTYPNIKIVSRDGSLTYHNSITEAHAEAIQVSDRFHLYKNLTDYAIEYLKKHLKTIIEVVINATDADIVGSVASEITKDNENRKLTLEEKYHKILLLQTQSKNQTVICREINMDIRSYKKLMTASDEERRNMFTTAMDTRHQDKISNKMKIVNEVRKLKNMGLSKRSISRKTGLSRITISKYLDDNFNPVHAAYGVKKAGKLRVFHNDIDNLLNQGFMGSKIEQIIRDKGYKGSSSAVRHYVCEWKKKFKNHRDEVDEHRKKFHIKRNDIFKTLFRPLTKVKNLEQDKFHHFCEQYPFFKIILNLIQSFKAIFEEKTPELLPEWINKARSTKVKEIISFTNGIERDYEAVKNAVCLPYSNGLAEGSINKIKVIKRVMYGRCSFETLRNKTIRLEKMRKIN